MRVVCVVCVRGRRMVLHDEMRSRALLLLLLRVHPAHVGVLGLVLDRHGGAPEEVARIRRVDVVGERLGGIVHDEQVVCPFPHGARGRAVHVVQGIEGRPRLPVHGRAAGERGVSVQAQRRIACRARRRIQVACVGRVGREGIVQRGVEVLVLALGHCS